MDRRKEIGNDGENADYFGAEFGNITPFSCYCRVMFDKSPDKFTKDELKKAIENWKKLQKEFKGYYIDLANKKSNGSWYEQDSNEFSFHKNKQKMLSRNMNETNMRLTNEYNLEDLMKKIDSAILITSKATTFDINRWSFLPNGYPPKF